MEVSDGPPWQKLMYSQDFSQMSTKMSAETENSASVEEEATYEGRRLSSHEAEAPYQYYIDRDDELAEDGGTPMYEKDYYTYPPSGLQDDEYGPGGEREDDFLNRTQYPEDSEELPPMMPYPKRYHQLEEEATEFRSQPMEDFAPPNAPYGGQQKAEYSWLPPHSHYGDSYHLPDRAWGHTRRDRSQGVEGSYHAGGDTEQTDSPLSLYTVDREPYRPEDADDRAAGGMGSNPETCSSESTTRLNRNYDFPGSNVYTTSADMDDYKEEDGDCVGGRYSENDPPSSYRWHSEYPDGMENAEDPSSADWKRPDIHLFKTSSCKESVTSEKSSRLDPHTYQSYAAGLLYSSGRAEKFLKLQKHFAILERVMQLDSESGAKPQALSEHCSQWSELGKSEMNAGQNFQSKEELQDLYSELKEAKEKKEFFYEVDKTEQLQWSPQKDFGLKKQKPLKERVRSYGDLTEGNKSPKAFRAKDDLKRAVSFGALCQKFGSPVGQGNPDTAVSTQRSSDSGQKVSLHENSQSGRYSENKAARYSYPERTSDIQPSRKPAWQSGDSEDHLYSRDNARNASGRFWDSDSNVSRRKETESQSTPSTLPDSYFKEEKTPDLHSEHVSTNFPHSVPSHGSPTRKPFAAPETKVSINNSESLPEKCEHLSPRRPMPADQNKENENCALRHSREMSYLQIMDNAAKKSRQRAIHGTHMDPPRNDYEVYVEEIRKMTKENADASNLHIRSMSAPHSALKMSNHQALPRSQSSKESFFGLEEASSNSDNPESFDMETYSKFDPSPEIVVDSYSPPRSTLQVKVGPSGRHAKNDLVSGSVSASRTRAENDSSIYNAGMETFAHKENAARAPVGSDNSTCKADTWISAREDRIIRTTANNGKSIYKADTELPARKDSIARTAAKTDSSVYKADTELPARKDSITRTSAYKADTEIPARKDSITRTAAKTDSNVYKADTELPARKDSITRTSAYKADTEISARKDSITRTAAKTDSSVYKADTELPTRKDSITRTSAYKADTEIPARKDSITRTAPNTDSSVYKADKAFSGRTEYMTKTPVTNNNVYRAEMGVHGHKDCATRASVESYSSIFKTETGVSTQRDYATDSSDTTDSDVRQARKQYAEMPDILRMENCPDLSKKSGTKSPFSSDTIDRNPDSHTPHSMKLKGTFPNKPCDKVKETGHVEHEVKLQEQLNTDKQNVSTKGMEARPECGEKVAVFRVTNLRNLAANNDFSTSSLPWIKKSASDPTGRDLGPAVHEKTRQEFSKHPAEPVIRGTHFKLEADYKSSSPQKGYLSLSQQVKLPGVTDVNTTTSTARGVSAQRKVAPAVPPKKPPSLHFQPVPSLSGPSFSTRMRGADSAPRLAGNADYENVSSQDTSTPGRAEAGPFGGTTGKQRDIVFVNANAESFRQGDSSRGPTQTISAESKGRFGQRDVSKTSYREPDRDAGLGASSAAISTSRQPGDYDSGSDAHNTSVDPQYGVLRKWTAVADIYRDVEKSWSPTREAPPPFPRQQDHNNSSISSTDTFIVKDTDDEDNWDDVESSGTSVSQLREIFECRKRPSKSKSEPDLSLDSVSEEPRRPRSAKSQADLNASGSDEQSCRGGVPRTMSGDLADFRYQPRGVREEQTEQTDMGLRAWVRYTEKPRYDPYVPPEHILKEVSSASANRKLDVPKKKDHRPSQVSQMTLEYLDQIGSEWHQSSSGVPFSQRSSFRRDLSHQYVNEPALDTTTYPQTDDLKLKQSQLAAGGRFTTAGGLNQFPPQRPYSFHATGSTTDRATPEGDGKIQTTAVVHPQTPAARPRSQSRETPVVQPRSQIPHHAQPAASSKPHTPPQQPSVPAVRPRSQTYTSSRLPSQQKPNQPQQASTLSRTLSTWSQRSGAGRAEDVHRQRNADGGFSQRQSARSVPPEPSRPPPVSPQRVSRAQQHRRYSKSSDSEMSSGDYGGVYCVSTGSVWYGAEAEEAAESAVPPPTPPPPPVPPQPQSYSAAPSHAPTPSYTPSSSATPASHTFPRNPPGAGRQSRPQQRQQYLQPQQFSQTQPQQPYPQASQQDVKGPGGPPPPPPPPPPQARSSYSRAPPYSSGSTSAVPSAYAAPAPTGVWAPAVPPVPVVAPPAPPVRGGGGGTWGKGRGVSGGGVGLAPRAGTLPRAKGGSGSSGLSAAEQLGVARGPPPSAVSGGPGPSAAAGGGGPRPALLPSSSTSSFSNTNTSSSASSSSAARAFRHQTSDTQRPRPEPVNPEKERRRREEEEAYRKKRLEELYEEERMRKIKKDEADAEARRHHDYFMNSQKSPISPNRFDDSPGHGGPSSLSPSQPGSLGTLERKDKQLSVPPERRRGFQIQGKARALFNFNAQNPRELSFRKNDVIYLLRQVDKNWFEGERHGLVGIFPTNYVEVVTSIEAAKAAAMQAEGQGRAKYSFTAQSSVELSIRKGEFVVLLRRIDDNWYEGRIGNRQGIFPVSYVEITREPSTPLITPAPSVITTPMAGTPEMLSPVGYDPAPTPPPQPSPSAFLSQRSPTASYGYRHPHQQQQQSFFGPSAPILTPAAPSSVSQQQISLSRQDGSNAFANNPKSPVGNARSPISPGARLGSPGQGRKVAGSQPVSSGPLQVDIHSKSKPYANGQPPKSNRVADDDLALTRYRALYAYRPQNEDELELRDGDEVFVMEKCDDGWFVGTSARSGCFGTFPGNYVQKICK